MNHVVESGIQPSRRTPVKSVATSMITAAFLLAAGQPAAARDPSPMSVEIGKVTCEAVVVEHRSRGEADQGLTLGKILSNSEILGSKTSIHFQGHASYATERMGANGSDDGVAYALVQVLPTGGEPHWLVALTGTKPGEADTVRKLIARCPSMPPQEAVAEFARTAF